MTETEFWTELEFLVSRTLAELANNRLRFLWCDGFFPDDVQPSDDSVIGYALISEDDGKTFERYRFRLWLSPRSHVEGRIDWDAVLPPHQAPDWLRVDREHRSIEMFS